MRSRKVSIYLWLYNAVEVPVSSAKTLEKARAPPIFSMEGYQTELVVNPILASCPCTRTGNLDHRQSCSAQVSLNFYNACIPITDF